jgi:hypothetical protein
MIKFAAGRCAQRKFGARHEAFDAVCADDDEKIEALAQRFDSPSEVIREIRHEAEQLVNEHWREIRAVARALMAQGHLDEAAIRAAIANARPSTHGRTPIDRAPAARVELVFSDDDPLIMRRTDGWVGSGTAPAGARRRSAEPDMTWRTDGWLAGRA